MNPLLFIGFFISYSNILHFSFPLGIAYLLTVIFINFLVYIIYEKFFENYKTEEEKEKELLFTYCLKIQKKDETIKECSICFDETPIKNLYELNCSCLDKFYHKDCLKKWLCKSGSCPFCRKEMYL